MPTASPHLTSLARSFSLTACGCCCPVAALLKPCSLARALSNRLPLPAASRHGHEQLKHKLAPVSPPLTPLRLQLASRPAAQAPHKTPPQEISTHVGTGAHAAYTQRCLHATPTRAERSCLHTDAACALWWHRSTLKLLLPQSPRPQSPRPRRACRRAPPPAPSSPRIHTPGCAAEARRRGQGGRRQRGGDTWMRRLHVSVHVPLTCQCRCAFSSPSVQRA